MNEVYRHQTSSTFSYVLVAAGLLALQVPMHRDFAGDDRILQRSYVSAANESTFNSIGSKSIGSAITGAYEAEATPFRLSVTNFYARLLASQEPLGVEFEKVLYDNLWDLYES